MNRILATAVLLTAASLTFPLPTGATTIQSGGQARQSPTPTGQSASSSTNADEQTIRDLIRQEEEGKQAIKYTDDSIFVSGAFPQPLIGLEGRRAAQPRRDELAKIRLNAKTKREVKRLVVSQSGDLAYDFGNFQMSYDTPEKKHVSFEGSYLRVWRKVGGEWKIDAFFNRPNQPAQQSSGADQKSSQ